MPGSVDDEDEDEDVSKGVGSGAFAAASPAGLMHNATLTALLLSNNRIGSDALRLPVELAPNTCIVQSHRGTRQSNTGAL